MNDTFDQAAQKRGRRKFLLIAAVFALPVLASWLLFFAFPAWIPADTTNRGDLVQPGRPTIELPLVDEAGEPVRLTNRWSLVLFDDGDCGRVCAQRLLMTRQLRLTLNNRMTRLDRVLIVPQGTDVAALHALLDAAHPDLRIVLDQGGEASALFGPRGTPPATGSLHLVDPIGNYMMRYAPGFEAEPLRKDIVRLLRASQIG